MITVVRDGQTLEIPVTPAEAPDGGGRIGVQLAMNAKITRTVAKNPVQASQLAAKEFKKLLTTVTSGGRSGVAGSWLTSGCQVDCQGVPEAAHYLDLGSAVRVVYFDTQPRSYASCSPPWCQLRGHG